MKARQLPERHGSGGLWCVSCKYVYTCVHGHCACSGYLMYMQAVGLFSDEKAKLKKENDKLKKKITRLKGEKAKHSGVSSSHITCHVMCVHHLPLSSQRRERLYRGKWIT